MDNNELALLHQKIDRLTEQLDEQRRRQEEAEELRQDVLPILNHAVRLTIDELADVGGEFESEDIVYLVKYLLRNTRQLIDALERAESTIAFLDELNILVKPMFDSTVEQLNTMEQDGFFTFARYGNYMAQRVVSEFGEDDLKALADNVVTILETIRNMTQPDIMAMANTAVDHLREDEWTDRKVSLWRVFREMSDPEVRRGMMRMLSMLKAVGEAPTGQIEIGNENPN